MRKPRAVLARDGTREGPPPQRGGALVRVARASIDEGRALDKLRKFVEATGGSLSEA